MARETVRFPDRAVLLPLQYFGSVQYYALMSAFSSVIIDDTARYDKRFKTAHRMSVADTHGPVTLTVPVAKPKLLPDSRPTWRDVALSTHGAWWHTVSLTLASAYGRTPFYEFYVDRLSPFFSSVTPESFPDVATLDTALNRVVRAILGLDNDIMLRSQASLTQMPVVRGPETAELMSALPVLPYYQVGARKHGFIPGLSILDLIFNLGPEAPLYLYQLTSAL